LRKPEYQIVVLCQGNYIIIPLDFAEVVYHKAGTGYIYSLYGLGCDELCDMPRFQCFDGTGYCVGVAVFRYCVTICSSVVCIIRVLLVCVCVCICVCAWRVCV